MTDLYSPNNVSCIHETFNVYDTFRLMIKHFNTENNSVEDKRRRDFKKFYRHAIHSAFSWRRGRERCNSRLIKSNLHN